MVKNVVNLIINTTVTLVVLSAVTTALGDVLGNIIASYEGTMYWGPIGAIILIVGIPIELIKVLSNIINDA